jgi:hypothetical protein
VAQYQSQYLKTGLSQSTGHPYVADTRNGFLADCGEVVPVGRFSIVVRGRL